MTNICDLKTTKKKKRTHASCLPGCGALQYGTLATHITWCAAEWGRAIMNAALPDKFRDNP